MQNETQNSTIQNQQNLNNQNPSLQGDALQNQNTAKPSFLKNKWLMGGIVFLVLIIFLGGTFVLGGKLMNKPQNSIATPTVTPSPTPISTTDASAWKIYTGNNYSLKYPSNWTNANDGIISEKLFDPDTSDRSKTYNAISINDYPDQMYTGYTNRQWFDKISNLDKPFIDQRSVLTKLSIGTIPNGESYVIFKDEPSSTFIGDVAKQVKAYVLKDQTIYQLTLDLYDQNGLKTFEKIISMFTPTSELTAPTPTCRPRPSCLDSFPRCMIPETSDMCPRTVTPTPSSNNNQTVCAQDAKLCPNGSYVGRTGPDCKFVCP